MKNPLTKKSYHFKLLKIKYIYIYIYILNEYSTTQLNWPNDWSVLWVLICTVHLTVCSNHVTYAFQSEPTLSSCLNAKELLAWNRRGIWSLSHCNWTRTNNHLVRKRTLNHLAKLAGSLSSVVNTYLCASFDYMSLSSYVHVSEWRHTP